MPASEKPNPGSDEALNRGCKCAVIDNAHGRGYMEKSDVFAIKEDCPIHGLTQKGAHNASK